MSLEEITLQRCSAIAPSNNSNKIADISLCLGGEFIAAHEILEIKESLFVNLSMRIIGEDAEKNECFVLECTCSAHFISSRNASVNLRQLIQIPDFCFAPIICFARDTLLQLANKMDVSLPQISMNSDIGEVKLSLQPVGINARR
ncbi:MAG: hypothetical protein R8K21_05700 [Mariprofundales bacterium]